MGSDYGYSSTINLGKTQLGGVIFGAKKTTIKECLSKQLFGKSQNSTYNHSFPLKSHIKPQKTSILNFLLIQITNL